MTFCNCFPNFLKKTKIETEFPICFYMELMYPTVDTVLKTGTIQLLHMLV